MKISEMGKIIDIAFKAREMGEIWNPLFISPPGGGKSTVLINYCKDRGLPFITFTSATLEPPDVKGFPHIVDGRTKFAIPFTLPTEGKGMVILEEINRGSTAVMNCWMSLTDIRRGFDEYKLPEGWIVVGAINPENTTYDVNNMDPALKDRFEMFYVDYSKEDFLKYVTAAKWDETLVNFIEAGLWMYKTPEEISANPGNKYISPRTLSKVNTVLKVGIDRDDEHMIFSSLLGANVAKDYINFRHNETPVTYYDLEHRTLPSLEKLQKFSNPSNYKGGMIAITVKNIIKDGVDIKDSLLSSVLLSIPVEQGVPLVFELERVRKVKEGSLLERLCSESKHIKELFKSVVKK